MWGSACLVPCCDSYWLWLNTGGIYNRPSMRCVRLVQVGVEKEKVNAENAAAQVEAETCAAIAREVTELQARCESELSAAEPLVAEAMAALDTLTKKDLGGCLLDGRARC